jgi:hypothetical protein
VTQKIPKDEEAIAWNHYQGSSSINVKWDDWHLDGVKKSIIAASIAGLDFCGVDVIVDKDNCAYILEVNSAPSVPPISDGDREGEPSYNQKCLAKGLSFLLGNHNKHIPVVDTDNYRGYIHPAITDRAKV